MSLAKLGEELVFVVRTEANVRAVLLGAATALNLGSAYGHTCGLVGCLGNLKLVLIATLANLNEVIHTTATLEALVCALERAGALVSC